LAWQLVHYVCDEMRACSELIRKCLERTHEIDGDIDEIGVSDGQSAALLCKLAGESNVHLFDTFNGIPESEITEGLDDEPAGAFRASVEQVERTLLKFDNYKLHKGVFPHTAVQLGPLRFVHIDCDLYKTTSAALDWAWPQIEVGGLILDDDYLWEQCRGARLAVDEFVARVECNLEINTQRAIIRKG